MKRIRELERKKEKGRLYSLKARHRRISAIASTSVLLGVSDFV
jgi:hypothetical protein